MGAAFHDQERTERAERESAALLAIPNRAKLALQAIVSKLKKHHQVGTFAIVGAAHQRDVALSRPNAGECDAHGVDAGQLLAHEGARGPGHAVDDRDIAGQQVGELSEKQGRPQIVHQVFVEEHVGPRRLRQGAEDRPVHRLVALAAAGRDNHVHVPEQRGIALATGAVERETGRIGSDPLPGLHLPLVTLLRDLLVEIDRRERMDDVGREGFCIDDRLRRVEPLPVRVQPLAQTRQNADAGDPGFVRRFSHERAPSWETRCAPPPLPYSGATAGRETA